MQNRKSGIQGARQMVRYLCSKHAGGVFVKLAILLLRAATCFVAGPEGSTPFDAKTIDTQDLTLILQRVVRTNKLPAIV